MLTTMWKVLGFRLEREEYDRLGWRELALGLVLAWVVGYGRWWDRPDAVHALLRSGAISALIVVLLGLLLHVTLTPLSAGRARLLPTTAYVGLTSLPAALYALPLERWFELETARSLNLALLALVATWRVALYVRLAWEVARVRGLELLVVTLLPLSGVVFGLTVSGMLLGVFQLMAGNESSTTTAESRYEVILALGMASLVLGPVLLITWLVLVARSRRAARRDLAATEGGQ